MSKRIGIYGGTFNPVHAGHISFALQALNEARLDKIYLMPERHSRKKTEVEHFAHRVAMVRQAVKPYRKLGLIENTEVSFSVEKTLPRLQKRFPEAELVFLFGSDTLSGIGDWPHISRLLRETELAVGIREGDAEKIYLLINNLPLQPKQLYLINSIAPAVSSRKIREALRSDSHAEGILKSVRRYSDRNWLYVSLG